MTDINREQSKWSHEKDKAIIAYNQQNREFYSTVAGRGFLILPGFAYEIQNDLEYGTKVKLSDLNFDILSDTITRELKQRGLDLDIAFKNDTIAWELEKQSLLGLWEQEHADIKMGMALTEEDLMRLLAVIQARNSYLMTQKIAIELSAEELRRQIAAVADGSADLEVTLAQQKVLTMEKKLEIIPVLQLIVQAERELIIEKNNLMVSKNNLITLTGGLLQYENALAIAKADHVVATQDLMIAQAAVVALEEELVKLKLLSIPDMNALITAKAAIVASQRLLATAKDNLIDAQSGSGPGSIPGKKLAIMAAKEGLILEEKNVFAVQQELNVVLEELSDKKLTLVKIYEDILEQLPRLSEAILDNAANLNEIGKEQIYQVYEKIDTNRQVVNRAKTMGEIAGIQNEIEILEIEIKGLVDKAKTDSLTQEGKDIKATAKEETKVIDDTNKLDKAVNDLILTNRKAATATDLSDRIADANTLNINDFYTLNFVQNEKLATLTDEAKWKIETEITAKLSHLLSM
jgi:hypothetical protein